VYPTHLCQDAVTWVDQRSRPAFSLDLEAEASRSDTWPSACRSESIPLNDR
jgi:hypothetical protein